MEVLPKGASCYDRTVVFRRKHTDKNPSMYTTDRDPRMYPSSIYARFNVSMFLRFGGGGDSDEDDDDYDGDNRGVASAAAADAASGSAHAPPTDPRGIDRVLRPRCAVCAWACQDPDSAGAGVGARGGLMPPSVALLAHFGSSLLSSSVKPRPSRRSGHVAVMVRRIAAPASCSHRWMCAWLSLVAFQTVLCCVASDSTALLAHVRTRRQDFCYLSEHTASSPSCGLTRTAVLELALLWTPCQPARTNCEPYARFAVRCACGIHFDADVQQADDTYMYTYGGYDPPSTQFSEMWRFHVLRETWERVRMHGHV